MEERMVPSLRHSPSTKPYSESTSPYPDIFFEATLSKVTMEGKQNISDFRKMLDTSLASDSLSGKESIRKLVQNQIHSPPSEFLETRVSELSDLITLLRSASGIDFKTSKMNGASQNGWKLKQDKENYRVLYREGPQGSLVHTVSAEGYGNAPLDTFLCTGWEASEYSQWWPRSDFPAFKVDKSCCLKKVRIDEHISLLRMKLPWPVSDRDLVLSYFLLEFFEDGLVIALINSIPDTESVKKYMQGFEDQASKSKSTIRMEWTGGFAIKKITADRSYMRFVGNLDIKLEYVPQTFVNFITRQILGGSCKLFQKRVESEAKGNGVLSKVLEEPLYFRVREHLSRRNALGPKPHHREESENQNAHKRTSA